MLTFHASRAIAVGEAMVEMAPVGDGLYRRGFAGDTYNTIWHMAQILGDRVEAGFVTRVGSDALSGRFLAEMEADGLDCSGITRDDEREMGLYLIELDGAERSFSYWRDASAARRLASDRASLDAAFSGAGLIHLSGITLAILPAVDRDLLLDRLASARAGGAVVSFDPNVRLRLWHSMDEARDAISRILALVDIALPSFDDEQTVWGDEDPAATIDRFARAGVGEVVVKNGAGPVMLSSEGAVSTFETPPVSDVIDTSGAGDAFNAGYLSARLVGEEPARAVVLGQAVSAVVLGHYGARALKERFRDGLTERLGLDPLGIQRT